MSVSINWQPILGGILIAGGAIWAAVQAWRSRPVKAPNPGRPVEPDDPSHRSADEPPPPGAQEWVIDIHSAMGDASEESVLACLRNGATRDQARMARIAELEARTV